MNAAEVVDAKPEVTQRDLLGVFKWGLKKWGIEVIMEQRTISNWNTRMLDVAAVVETYLRAYRDLIVTERVSDRDVIISFPLHLAANHRIEIAVTRIGESRYVLSDLARTLGELEAAGYSLTTKMRDRLEKLASISGVQVVDRYLILETHEREIGQSMQRLLEVSKTIGDVYLVHNLKITQGREDTDLDLL